jgi:mitochondrial fission protein ELM1
MPPPPNVIPTLGALNRVVPGLPESAKGRLILIGGPSAHHGWNGETLAAAIREIVSEPCDLPWEAADSRRTPERFLERLAEELPGLPIHPHGETGPDWLARRFSTIAEAWVTEDSVSMVCEALTAGARVGVLPMPRTSKKSRVVRGLEILVADGYATPFDTWHARRALSPPPSRLAEADRCAEIILTRFFADAKSNSGP